MNTATVTIRVPSDTADIYEKLKDDDRVIELAITSFGNVLRAYERAQARESDSNDFLKEVRTSITAVRDHIDALQDAAQRRDDEREVTLAALREDGTKTHAAILEALAANTLQTRESVETSARSGVQSAFGDPNVQSAIAGMRSDAIRQNLDLLDTSIRATVNARMDALSGSLEGVSAAVNATYTHTQELRSKYDSERVRAGNSSLRGQDAEDELVRWLQSRLLACDGWAIENVHAQSRSCDILVRRDGCASVRLECKRKKHIERSDVEKFRRDLDYTGDHGIMISLEGTCVPGYPVGATFERLHTHAGLRWSGFVVVGADDPHTDLSHIISAVKVVQQLAHLGCAESSAREEDADAITLHGRDIDSVRAEITRARNEIGSAKERLKAALSDTNAALSCLDRVALHRIMTAVNGEGVDMSGGGHDSASAYAGQCRHCGEKLKTAAGLARHERETCRKRPTS